MAKIQTIRSMSFLFCGAFILSSCTPATQYCSFATRSNRCDIEKDKILCFQCTGNSCPDLTNKQVYLKKNGDSCLVSLGNKISDCGKCAAADSIVVLGSIALKEEPF
jgi:hypothetical protein